MDKSGTDDTVDKRVLSSRQHRVHCHYRGYLGGMTFVVVFADAMVLFMLHPRHCLHHQHSPEPAIP